MCPDAAPPGVRMRRATRSKYRSVPPRTVRVRPRRTRPGPLEHGEVVGDVALVRAEPCGQLADRGTVGAEREQQPHPCRVAEGAQLLGVGDVEQVGVHVIKRQEQLTLCQAPDPDSARMEATHTTRPDTSPSAATAATTGVAARCADLVAERFVLPAGGCAGRRPAARARRRRRLRRPRPGIPGRGAERRPAQDVAHDLHLRVIHHPDGVPPTEDPAAYEDYWREMARTTAGGMRRVERLAGNVAHLSVGPVLAPAGPSWDAVTAAMALVADADALVLDVRECRGGDPDTVQLLLSHVVGDEPVRLVDIESRVEGLRQRWTHPVAARRFGPDRPLVVLTSAATFSGGEEVAFDVQLLGRGPGRGGAHPRRRQPARGRRRAPRARARRAGGPGAAARATAAPGRASGCSPTSSARPTRRSTGRPSRPAAGRA